MTHPMVNVIAAELIKLRSLPAVLTAMGATVVVAAALSAAIAAADASVDAGHIIADSIRYVQVGPTVLAVLAAGTEYSGRGMRIALIATPGRMLLLAGKSVAYLVAAAVTSAAGLGAGLLTVALVGLLEGSPVGLHASIWLQLLGAWTYLVLIGLLAPAVTILLRSMIASLVTMLGLVLIVPPLLASVTSAAQYLPDRAGSILYQPDVHQPDVAEMLSPATGALILVAWVAVAGAGAVITFCARDAPGDA
jgi:hypothetical protein